MRVLFVYQFLTLGGVEAVLRNRYLGLKGLGRQVEVESLFLTQSVKPQRELGDRVTVTSDPAEIAKAVRRADVVSAIDTPQVFPILDREKVPAIVEVHSAYDEGRAYIRQKLPRPTRLVLTPSVAFQKQVERELREGLAVEHLYNPLAPDYFDGEAPPAPGNLDLHGARPIFWVGRLDGLKDWERAVRIAGKVIAALKRPEIELFILGRHPEPAVPVQAFRKAGILGRVRHVAAAGFQSMPGLYRLVAAHGGIHLATSRAESFGMTVAESMASGLPCVLHRIPEFEEVSGGQASYFRSDKEAVEGAVELLSDRAAWEKSAKALRKSAERFKVEPLAGQLYDKLAHVASRARP